MTVTSMSPWLDSLAAPLDGLVDPAGMQDLRTVADLLPAALTGHFGLECRLGSPERKADLLLLVHRAQSLPPLWPACEEWARRWADPQSPLHEGADHVWLEFDVPHTVPSFFFAPVLARWDGQTWLQPDDPWTPAFHIIQEGLRALGQVPSAFLRRCVDALPRHGRIFQVGCMLARSGAPVRLCISNLDGPQSLNYLHQVGWRGEFDWVDRWRGRCDKALLQIDLGPDGVGSKIGLECYVAPGRWSEFIANLLEEGLCLQSKADALQSWTGRDAGLLRRIHHIKLSASEAKAYLSVTPP